MIKDFLLQLILLYRGEKKLLASFLLNHLCVIAGLPCGKDFPPHIQMGSWCTLLCACQL